MHPPRSYFCIRIRCVTRGRRAVGHLFKSARLPHILLHSTTWSTWPPPPPPPPPPPAAARNSVTLSCNPHTHRTTASATDQLTRQHVLSESTLSIDILSHSRHFTLSSSLCLSFHSPLAIFSPPPTPPNNLPIDMSSAARRRPRDEDSENIDPTRSSPLLPPPPPPLPLPPLPRLPPRDAGSLATRLAHSPRKSWPATSRGASSGSSARRLRARATEKSTVVATATLSRSTTTATRYDARSKPSSGRAA